MNSISIIICFYNAESRLQKTLEYIKRLSIEGIDSVELILVNNNSNDNSEKIIKNELEDFKIFPWKIIQESTPGLTNARLAGIKAAKNEILLFCDDDNWLFEDYLQVGISILNKDEKIAVLGGKGEAISSIQVPIWFENYQNFYAVGPQMPQSGLVKGVRNVVYGAGMFVIKDYFIDLSNRGYVPFSSDRVGESLSSGGDSEMCLAFQIAGYKIWYDENLHFKHFIEPKRLSLEYLNKLKKGMISSSFISRFYRDFLFGYEPKITKIFWLKEMFFLMKDIFLDVFRLKFKGQRRNILFLIFLLKERSKYDNSVSHIVSICKKIKND